MPRAYGHDDFGEPKLKVPYVRIVGILGLKLLGFDYFPVFEALGLFFLRLKRS
jgi:hypothetical protein